MGNTRIQEIWQVAPLRLINQRFSSQYNLSEVIFGFAGMCRETNFLTLSAEFLSASASFFIRSKNKKRYDRMRFIDVHISMMP